eukprot:4739713-Prymnesium_polylepis.1
MRTVHCDVIGAAGSFARARGGRGEHASSQRRALADFGWLCVLRVCWSGAKEQEAQERVGGHYVAVSESST